MQGVGHCPDAYEDCLVVQKLEEGARHLFVFDKNYSIQRYPQPVANPPQSEMIAGKAIRKVTEPYPTIFSSAQTLELTIDSVLFNRSVADGYNRPPPKILLPDGSYTARPEDVKGWEYLLNPDAFIGFGTGIYSRKNSRYRKDIEFETALGGSMWRPQFFASLDYLYPDKRYVRSLTPVDREDPDADVAPPEFRVEFLHYGEEGRAERDDLVLRVLKGQLQSTFTKNVVFVDESNPATEVYRTYALPIFGVKDLGLERFGNQAAVHAHVPMEEISVIVVGDAPPDVKSALQAFAGAKEVQFILAANSRISESILNNSDFGGVALPGCPNHPELPGRFHETETPGVLWWRGANGQRPRKIFLAHYTPWSKGLECTESVQATLDHLGFR